MHENRETSATPAEEGRPARQGQGRNARMHVAEGSDSGIVPMNHSNKDHSRGEWGGKAADQGEHSILETTDRPSAVKGGGLEEECAEQSAAMIRDKSRMR